MHIQGHKVSLMSHEQGEWKDARAEGTEARAASAELEESQVRMSSALERGSQAFPSYSAYGEDGDAGILAPIIIHTQDFCPCSFPL